MKVQQRQAGIDGDTFVYRTMLEGIIQAIVYWATAYNNHTDCPYTSEIFSVGITVDNPPYSIFIMDIIQGLTLYDTLSGGGGVVMLNRCVKNIMRKLISLNTFYNFNHVDFHSQNILMNQNENIVIIDFGFSTIRLKGYMWKCPNCTLDNLESRVECSACGRARNAGDIANIVDYYISFENVQILL
jgi:serine/threonine protein kinase